MKPTPNGLVKIPEIAQPISAGTLSSAGVTVAWPFPQLFRGERQTLLFDEAAGFVVTESGWSLAAMSLLDPADQVSSVTLSGDGAWQFIDMGNAWIALNGSESILRTNFHNVGSVSVVEGYYASTSFGPRTGANFKGKLLLGGFTGGETHPLFTLGAQTILWADPGAAFWPWFAEAAPKEIYRDVVAASGVGILEIPLQGNLERMLQLGDSLIVYGARGIGALQPTVLQVTAGEAEDRAIFGYKWRQLLDVGIAGRSAVNGDDSQHVFVTTDGALWSLTADLQATRLDYSEFLSGLSDPVVSFLGGLDGTREWFVSNGTNSYLWNGVGLSEAVQAASSLIENLGAPAGIPIALGTTLLVKTEGFDMGASDRKQMRRIETAFRGITDPLVRMTYRNSRTGGFTNATQVTPTASGLSYHPSRGREFQVEWSGTAASGAQLEYANLRWQWGSHEARRGEVAQNIRSL